MKLDGQENGPELRPTFKVGDNNHKQRGGGLRKVRK